MENVVQEYQKLVSVVQEQNSSVEKKFNTLQDGHIVLDMLLRGMDRNEVKLAVAEHSPREGAFMPVYADKLFDSADKSMEAYSSIKTIAKSENDKEITPETMYKMYAAEILEKRPEGRLNGLDDQGIVARMRGAKISEEAVMKVLQECSPVAKEPGRNAEYYTKTVIKVANKKYEQKAAYAKDISAKYPTVLEAYNKKISDYIPDDKTVKNRTYIDGLVAKELFLEKHDVNNIAKAIAEHSPKAAEINENRPNKTPEGYAQYIMNSVRSQCAAEKEIISFTSSENMKPADVYRSIIKDRMKLYPDTAAQLSKSFIDRDVATKMLNRGYEHKDIVDAIKEASPRAKTPGLPLTYAEQTVDAARAAIAEKTEKANEQAKPFTPTARKDHAEYASEEYQHHVEQCAKITKANLTPKIDHEIAKTLIKQGYEAKAVQAALQQSPCAPTRTDEARKYGQAIVREIKNELKVETKKTQSRAV